ncbi:transmembrane protein 131-like isoform X2 [Littorina saxatilis]|uniref:transmembrane protein 131-like isoform X2 n=1 Tax=Littorina saxatilis TaxID=31220 RepID=UPI0038B6487D
MEKMARLDLHTTDGVLDILRFVLLVQTLQYCLSCMCVAESHNQAFIQTDKHLTYIDGDLSGVPLEINPGHTVFSAEPLLDDENFYSSGIRLDPPMLDFEEQPVGMPRMEKVIVQNTDSKNSLHLLSISGSTNHFHCSFFQDKTVPPGGNTTFDVVFLARQVGNVENTLYIHTSIGSVRYQVFGVGIPNPFRLRPYLGARVPINNSFSPVIQMHNPYGSKIQVVEMFSSEGDLHLELPSGEREATQELWEIKPYETKNVMRANFVGRVESNHTAFIRIKTDQDSSEKLLILPVEVEFSAEPGIYSPIEMLDFGILRTLDDPKTLRLNLINTGVKAAHITSVTVSPPNDAISIDFRPLKLQPDSSRQYTAAHITFRAVKALQPKQWSGKITVKTKNNHQKLVIPYQASVLHGSLVYNANTTYFFSAKVLKNLTRPLTLTNTFNFSVVIFNISLPPEAAQFFTVLNFSSPVIVGPQQTVMPLLLLFHPNATQLTFTTTLTLHTNASTFLIPLIVYNGLLKVIHHRPEKSQGQMDFGTMGVNETRSMIFTIRNDNPVDLVMARFETNMSWAKIELLGVEKGNGTTLTRLHNASDIDTDPLIIKPYHYAVFTVNIVAPHVEGAYAAEVWMFTQFEDLFIPITFRTAEGSLYAIPEKFLFEKVFPGKVPYKVLQIHSTFQDYMVVTQVTFQPQDMRFYFQEQDSNIILKPQAATVVGKIFFDSKRECKDDCYVGLPTFTPAGHQWLLGLTLDKDVADTDQYLYTRLQQKWHRLERTGQNTANVTIELDTNQVRGFLFSAQAHLHWPSLVRKSKLKFPLTQIGNISRADFIVENSADTPVLIQVLPLSLYPNPGTIIDLTSHGLSSDLTDFIETEDLDTFRLYDLENLTPGASSPVLDHIKNVENTLGVTPHKQSIAAILQPGGKLKVQIGFQPRDDLARSSLILIRNNLTIMDTVVVTGQGCSGEMKFSNKKPGSQSPLTFEMTEKHLKNCDISEKKPSKLLVPHFTVRRQFTMRNTGQLAFYVQGFSINDSPCEGYGFKVLDCDGFEMLPNTTKKVDIAFTPDFTMSRIRRMLTVHTSLGPPANYTLQATVPPHLLSRCSSALPRPHWEPVLYYCIMCIMSFLFLCICLAAYFEGDRIIMADIIRRKLKVSNATQTFDKGKVFDLRNVAGLGPVSPRSPSAVQSMPSSSALGQDLRVAAAKSMIQANGHVEYHSQTNGHKPLLGRILSTIRRLNPSQLLFASSKSNMLKAPSKAPESNGSCLSKESEPPVLTRTNSNSGRTTISSDSTSPVEQPSALETTVALDKTYTNHVKATKKGKASKRHMTDNGNIIPNGSAPEDISDYKLNKDSSCPSAAKKLAEADDDPRDRSTASEAADDYLDDDTSPILDSTHTSRLPAKVRGKKLRGKSRGERDLLKERLLRRDNSVPDDKDETSSTTTDSSAGGEQDDKNSNARDSTPEPYIPMNLGGPRKSKKKPDRAVAAVFNGDLTEDDNNFELTSKSKAHRKIRVNPKIFGGDIMRPSTLELDYTLPKEKEQNGALANADLQRRSKKARAQPKSDYLLRTVGDDDSDRDSPPPAWDQPTSCSPAPDDLSELSIQTETFAQQSGGVGSAGFGRTGGGLSPDNLSGSSRSSSYSSIVSATGLGSPTTTQTDAVASSQRLAGRSHHSPLGDGGRFQAGFPAYSEPSLAGLAPPKTSPGLMTAEARPNGQWTSVPVNPNLNGPVGSNFRLQTIDEHTAPFFGPQPNADGFAKPEYFAAGGDNYLQYGDGSEHSLTMMQQLQAERRQRFLKFQQRKKEDWPGFDVPPVGNDSLWDSDYLPLDPHNAWTSPSDPPATTASSGFWSTLTNSASSGWNSLQNLANIWSPSTPTAPPPANSQSPPPTPPVAASATSLAVTTVAQNSTLRPDAPPFTAADSQAGYLSNAAVSAAAAAASIASAAPQSQMSDTNTFSPFSTPMADIWKPASTSSSGDTTWGQFLPPPPIKDDK